MSKNIEDTGEELGEWIQENLPRLGQRNTRPVNFGTFTVPAGQMVVESRSATVCRHLKCIEWTMTLKVKGITGEKI